MVVAKEELRTLLNHPGTCLCLSVCNVCALGSSMMFCSLMSTKHVVYTVSVQFSHSVMSDSLKPHEPQHARPPCPSPTPRVHSNSRPSSQWCHPAISSSVVPFSSCPQSLPASESFPVSQLFDVWWGLRMCDKHCVVPERAVIFLPPWFWY